MTRWGYRAAAAKELGITISRFDRGIASGEIVGVIRECKDGSGWTEYDLDTMRFVNRHVIDLSKIPPPSEDRRRR